MTTSAEATARARFSLLYELERSREAQHALNELSLATRGQALSPRGFADRPANDIEITDLSRLLDTELETGRIQLDFTPFAGVLRERETLELDLPLGSPKRATPVPDSSFIAVRLVDQKGAPVSGRPFQVELPDGSVRRGFTDPDGFGRVRGFTQDGSAKIVFPTFDERDFKTKNPIDKILIPVTLKPEPDPFAGLKSPEQAKQGEKAQSGQSKNAAAVAAAAAAASQKLATFTLIVLDDVGAPIEGIDLAFALPGGTLKLTTDPSGKAELGNAVGPARASFLDLAQVRKVLRPRFLAKEREPKPFDDNIAVVRPLTSTMDPIVLQPDQPAAVLLIPAIECHEIPGTTFEFGRSYVRGSALEQLADIAEALRNTTDLRAMVFGHTDISGSDALNKELSERRAKAVHALLTHDSAAWEQLFSGTADGKNWQEKWDVEEAQNMLKRSAAPTTKARR